MAAKSPGEVLVDVSDGIATVQLSNPERRNAVSATMWLALERFAGEVGADPAVRVVLVRGAGHAVFSGGADISDFAQARSGAGQAQDYDDIVESSCRAFEAIAQPTIAVIDGPCVGAGASLAASCDMRVAAAGAFFAVPAARLGLGYDPRGIARFIRVFGANLTRSLLFTAARLPAERALAAGAVYAMHPQAEMDTAVQDLARGIAGNAPMTLRAAKLALRALTVDRDAGLLEQAQALSVAADASEDYVEGRAAFLAKRPARFQGR